MALMESLKDQFRLLKQQRKFYKFHHYNLDLNNPRTFNEKIVWRKVFDRNPLFPQLADKFRAREYMREKLGEKTTEKLLAPLLLVTENPEEMFSHELPEEYIVKPNHGSGWYIIVDRERPAAQDKIVSQCRKWLWKTYGKSKMEWAYREIRPCILVEKLLRDREGTLASDFKFHVFNGKVAWVKVILDRFGSSTELSYDRAFNIINVSSDKRPVGTEIQKPKGFEEMIDIAEILAGSIDFLRVDFLTMKDQFFLGELTLYPSSGFIRFYPADFDIEWGKLWKLDRTHAREFRPVLYRIQDPLI